MFLLIFRVDFGIIVSDAFSSVSLLVFLDNRPDINKPVDTN